MLRIGVRNLQTSLPPIDTSIPNSKELEISIFGSHIGECIVVHLPGGKWLVVDSCQNSNTKKPVALEYFDSLGVDVKRDVALIVITHWHDDHIRGMGDLVEACDTARICFPSAMMKEEFLTLLSLHSGDSSLVDRQTSGTSEMAKSVKVLQHRNALVGTTIIPVGADRILLEENNCLIRSLSPSDKAFHNALASFTALLPETGTERKTLPRPTKNDNSIVLWLSCSGRIVLLGADLEETDDVETGWKAIVGSSVRPAGKASFFKIPHHGSITGHSDDVWEHMVKNHAVCLMTEHSRGGYSLPKDKDVERIKEKTTTLFCTSLPKHRIVKRENAVERTLRGMTTKRKSLGGSIGQVQIRVSNDSKMKVTMQEPAVML